MKIYVRNIAFIVGFLLIVCSCSDKSKSEFEFAGGEFRMALGAEPSTFVSRDVRDSYSAMVLTQVMECLVSLHPKDLSLQPQIAEYWKIKEQGKVYEFKIREGIKFHPHQIFNSDEERTLTPEDVKKSIELICKKNSLGEATNGYSICFKETLEGADDFHNDKTNEIKGLKINGDKVILRLIEKDNNFLKKLAHISCAIFSKKVHEANVEQDMIGTGPFKFKEYKQGECNSILLVRNEDYYLKDSKGNSLPYLDQLSYTIQPKKLEQLDMFENHELDFIVSLPTSRITKMLEGRLKDFNSVPPMLILSNNPMMTTHYFSFNLLDKRFANPKVRQAFNYALDKDKLGLEVLKNQYYEIGNYGIVPPLVNDYRGYDFKGVQANSYSFNPEKAKKLLTEAGYPNGQGFGSVNLRFSIDELQSAICDEVAQQINQVLGINVNIDGSTFEKLEKDADYGKGEMFKVGWGADYSSPESFLSIFYGKNVPNNPKSPSLYNQTRYSNPQFDKFFEMGKKSTKVAEQMLYFSEAEKILMKEPPFIPLWYRGDYSIVYSNVRDFYVNPLMILNFTRVYKKDWSKEEYLQKMKNGN